MKRSILFLLTIATLLVVSASHQVSPQDRTADRVEPESYYSVDVDVVKDVVIVTDFDADGLIAIKTGSYPEMIGSPTEGLQMPLFGTLDLPEGTTITHITNDRIRNPRDGLAIWPKGDSNNACLV